MPSFDAPTDEPSAGAGRSAHVFLVDDHPPILRALQDVIEEAQGLEVCGEATGPKEALRQIERDEPEVVILDISLKDAYGLDLLENLQAFVPETETVVYSLYEEEVYAERAVQAGASGYLQKSAPPEKVVEAIHTAVRGEVYLSPRMRKKILNRVVGEGDTGPESSISSLTDRELAVFQMLGLGYSLPEISERLNLARKTVETYRRRAKEKLGCDSISELIQVAVRWIEGQGHMRGHVGAGL